MKYRHVLVSLLLSCFIYTGWYLRAGRNESAKTRAAVAKAKTETGRVVFNSPCPQDGARKAILVSYMRSGTTFMGSAFEKNKDIFYVFEPEWDLIVHSLNFYKQLYYLDGSVRPPVWRDNGNPVIEELIQNYLCCNISGVDVHSLGQRFMHQAQHTEPLVSCMRKRNRTKDCIQDLTKTCKSKDFRFLKTVRVRMSVVETMLSKDGSLRVIHLIRDPRGIAVSRRGWLEYYAVEDTVTFGRVCAEILHDIETVEKMSPELSSRVLPVLYEDLAENPEVVMERLYAFLRAEMPGYVRDYLKDSTNASHDIRNGFSTVRQNSSKTANAWREKIDYNLCKKLDDICSRVYPKAGYLPVNSKKHLRDLTIPLRNVNGDYVNTFGNFVQQKIFPDKF